MRRQLTKRACDECISRKVKCSGSSPCDTCLKTSKEAGCTYLKPPGRRGPKARRYSSKSRSASDGSIGHAHTEEAAARTQSVENRPVIHADVHADTEGDESLSASDWRKETCIPKAILVYIVRLYQTFSYSVWPVVDADAVLQQLENGTCDAQTLCLVLALCAATMAQLQLAPMAGDDGHMVDSGLLKLECMRLRERSDYRENLDVKGVLVSFFLHVYHAKINQRKSAMLFIQEAVASARLLGLDTNERNTFVTDGVVANEEIVFLLLWVSERGYAMHLGVRPSYSDPVQVPDAAQLAMNPHAWGLLELFSLFVTFDKIRAQRCRSGSLAQALSPASLAETEAALSLLAFNSDHQASTRLADCYITREWMRTIVWQEALSRHLLSSTATTEVMTFRFPVIVGRDLLMSLHGLSETDLLPLGRDQVANSLADTVLYTPPSSFSRALQVGPQDFLHALYQKILPFLEHDPMLNSILRAKTAEALVMAPARLSVGLVARLDVEEESISQQNDRVH
ncbi:putative C6 transcription factor [Aspergillus fischeri NRRL 181]|uniref:C6 zinc finger domain protein n=1 Tax=Neosartorya fischeri (strain ATCC 1020 / DSM 3700 / CBS 544.65 / FGSC A1164 / JCM 1740 / NRRL 181 / WB 181) TaxID=331117 RepID=A1DFP0_NEOFI|nr:C6 zinc finger domain protein [Aspergillus fischeri NRRL 181]EAW18197.1 C6 zinc finger domain protein [Aspergillus fischeri NRRL 181]